MFWTSEEERLLLDLQGMTSPEISQVFASRGQDRSPSSIRAKVKRIQRQKFKLRDAQPAEEPKLDPGEIPVVWLDKKQTQVDWRASFEFAEKAQEYHNATSTAQDDARIQIVTDTPIAVTFSADWHFGSVSTDYGMLRAHLEYVLETPNLFLICNGDETDNMQMFFNAAARYQLFSPKDQHRIIEEIFAELAKRNKLLVAGHGNHGEEWQEKAIGFSPLANIKGDYCVYFRGMGKLFLTVGTQEYVIMLSHRGKGHSEYNPGHAANKQALMYCPEADVSVTAHRHTPFFSDTFGHGLSEKVPADMTFPDKRRICIATGCFKVLDPYAQRFFGRGRIGTPTVVFFPDKHDMLAFPTPEYAVQFLGSGKS